jgi:hypothetical protein
MAFSMLFALGGRGETLWVLLLLGASITRSLFHRAAGSVLLYGRPQDEGADGKNNRMHGVRRYIAVALIQCAIVGALLVGKFGVPGKLGLAIVGGLAVWPVFLAILLQLPRFKRYQDDLPLTEDKGFEGAAILMTVFGLCGVIGTGTILLFLLDMPGKALTRGAGVLIMLALGMLVMRSILHVQAGLSGLRETSVDRSVELVNRYANFGVISAFCGGGALMLFFMTSTMNIAGLAVIVGLCWMLMAWPLIVRRFFADRQFADLMAGEQAPLHRRAPDAGLTSLGWLLVAYAMYSASFLIPQLVLGGSPTGREFGTLFAMAGTGGFRSLWFSVGVAVFQAWAGYELVRMSPQSRVIATLFGIVAAIVTIYVNWPMIQVLKQMRGFVGFDQAVVIGPLVLSLIIPIATIVLVNRKITPTARARFRKPAPAPTTTPAETPPT